MKVAGRVRSASSTELRKYRLLYQIGKVLTSTLEPRLVLRRVLKEAIKVLKASYGSILLIEEGTDILSVEVALGITEEKIRSLALRVGEGVTGWVARTGKPLLVPDVKSEPRYVAAKRGVRSELAVPLILEGKVIGVINVDQTRVGGFTRTDQELLEAIASLAAKVIQNTKLFADLRHKAAALDTLFQVSKSLTGSLDLKAVLSEITNRTAALMSSRITSIMLLSEDEQQLILAAVHGGRGHYTNRPPLKVAQSLIGRTIRAHLPLQVPDVQATPDFMSLEMAKQEGLRSLLSVPLIRAGRPLGVINVYRPIPGPFPGEEVALLQNLADLAAVAIDNARLYERTLGLEEQIRKIEKLGVLGELALEVTHEIRNPLTVIKMLLHSLQVPDQQDVNVISAEIDRINRIVTQFMEYARPAEPRSEETDPNGLLARAIGLVRHRLEKQGIEFKERYGDLPTVRLDPDLFTQVFLNLLLNAIEAMPEGGTLRVATRRAGGSVKIQIADTGIGIPEELQPRIFLPFVSGKERGLGVGLSIVQRAVKQHRGTIEVASKPGEGTTFSITLPLE